MNDPHAAVNARNIAAVAESAKQERARVDDLAVKLQRLEALLAQTTARVTQLESQQGAVLAAAWGSGPTRGN